MRSLLVFENVLAVTSQGVTREDPEMILSPLALTFLPDAEPPSGLVEITLAGDGAIRLKVEALEAVLKDVTRPYRAPSGRAPDHGE